MSFVSNEVSKRVNKFLLLFFVWIEITNEVLVIQFVFEHPCLSHYRCDTCWTLQEQRSPEFEGNWRFELKQLQLHGDMTD